MLPAPVRPPPPPPALARRIDRLAWRAHAFHRWAHHPLCPAYAGEVVSLGRRVRLCRGCTFVACGAVVGTAAGLALPAGAPAAGLALAAAAALGAVSLGRRLSKLLSRALPAGLTALAAVSGPFAAAASAVVAGLAVIVYRRRGPDRAPCAACPERGAAVCTGYAPIVSRERAFQRLAARWLATWRAGS